MKELAVNAETTQLKKLHKFEEAGLGLAPFRFVCVEVRKYQACPGAPVQPGGCCAYCGEGIMECCIIRDSQGKVFMVGNVCVGKTGDRGLADVVKREINGLRTKARHAREFEKILALRARLKEPEIRERLKKQPHPLAGRPGRTFFTDRTRLDWADWMIAHSGNVGRLQVAAYLDQMAA